MQEVAEETKELQKEKRGGKRGKRGSRGNVLFSDTVHARQLGEVNQWGQNNVDDAYSDFTYSMHMTEMLGCGEEEEEGTSRVHRWLDSRRGELPHPVDIVQSVNTVEEEFRERDRERRREKGEREPL